MPVLFTILVATIGLGTLGSVLYLLLLLSAALMARREEPQLVGAPLRFTVVIPAHDEELVLAATLESLRAQEYPGERFEIVVVADNCTDATVQIACGGGARVLVRTNRDERGKGYALAWAFSRLIREPDPAEAFVILDADTWVAPDFLRIMASRLAQGGTALQGRYGVLNRTEGWRTALMACALDLVNHVQPLGRDRLGLSVSLKGNGMAFTRAVLEQASWRGHSITEDIDFGLDLLLKHGIRVRYVPNARVLAQMPTTATQAASQRERWEGGRYRLLRERALPLLRDGLLRRDLRLCDAGLSLLLPPVAELSGLIALWGALIALGGATHLLTGPAGWCGAFALSALGFVTYVLVGLRVADAPREAYLALLKAPFYAVWKFALYGSRLLRRRSQDHQAGKPEWVRTERAPISAPSSAEREQKSAATKRMIP